MALLEHTTTAFDSDLLELSRGLSEMGGLVERQVVEAIAALTSGDRERAKEVVAADAAVDGQQRAIEEQVVETIARRQPVAVDLRQVVSILRIALDLERVGDLAKNIGKRVSAIDREYLPWRAMGGVNHMVTLVLAQLREVLDCFANRDAAGAIDVWTRDHELDRLYTSLFRELLTEMMNDPRIITFCVHLLFCTKNIERMGDHTTNIAEAVYYMIEGRTLPQERPKADNTAAIAAAIGAA